MTTRMRHAAACVALALMLSLAGGCKAEAPAHDAPPPPPHGQAAKKGDTFQVWVKGTGRNVWILFIADGRQIDAQTSYHLPYYNEAKVSFGVKIDAKNGADDRGSIACSITTTQGTPVGLPQEAYGPSATVTCLFDATRA